MFFWKRKKSKLLQAIDRLPDKIDKYEDMRNLITEFENVKQLLYPASSFVSEIMNISKKDKIFLFDTLSKKLENYVSALHGVLVLSEKLVEAQKDNQQMMHEMKRYISYTDKCININEALTVVLVALRS